MITALILYTKTDTSSTHTVPFKIYIYTGKNLTFRRAIVWNWIETYYINHCLCTRSIFLARITTAWGRTHTNNWRQTYKKSVVFNISWPPERRAFWIYCVHIFPVSSSVWASQDNKYVSYSNLIRTFSNSINL